MSASTVPTPEQAEQLFGEVCGYLLHHYNSLNYNYTLYGVSEDNVRGINWIPTLNRLTPQFSAFPKEVVEKIEMVNSYMIASGAPYLKRSHRFLFGLHDTVANLCEDEDW